MTVKSLLMTQNCGYLTKALWWIRNINMFTDTIVFTIILVTQTLALYNRPHRIRFVTGQV